MKTTARLRTYSLLAILFSMAVAMPQKSLAQSDQKTYLLSQVDVDEAYDPFTDYSEFEEESDEEADINFFRNGRFFTIGLAGGMRGFTGNFADAYSAAPTFGIFLTYFFDLRLAMSLGFQTGDHAVKFKVLGKTDPYEGNVSITAVNFDLKYYMNTQNVTRGLADLNPYILGGLGQFYRTYTIAGLDGFSRDSTMGFDIGAGLEIPLMRKKAYLGLQGTYHYVNFSDENKNYVDGTEKLEKNLAGDFYNFLVILGMNF
nr:hypothetical protein CKG001_16740 [Bdellovibrio sp. CKG001]BFD62947.1 hypothetical protein BdHM001_16280 [Bdellovibrio sp. HM001]